jgi:hypothetical protein
VRSERRGKILILEIGISSFGPDSHQTTNRRSILHNAHGEHRERLNGRDQGLQGFVRSGWKSKSRTNLNIPVTRFYPAHHTARGGRSERCGKLPVLEIGSSSFGPDSHQTTNRRSILHNAHGEHRERLSGRSQGFQ